MLDFDEQATRRIEASYRTPDVVEQRRAFLAAVAPRAGEHALDVGAGTGLLAHELAAELGPSGSVHAIDPSESMLAMAARRTPGPGAAPVEFRDGDALALPFEDSTFDVVVSTQVYEYVEEIERALAEAHRVLRPGGRLAVLDTDWGSIVWHSPDPERMDRVLAVWDEHLADPWLPRRLSGLMRAAGFALTRAEAIPLLNTSFADETYSANLIGFVERFVAGRGGLGKDDVGAWARDQRTMGEDYFFSLNRYVFIGSRP